MNFLTTLFLYVFIMIGLIIWSPWGKNGENIKLFHFFYIVLAVIIWGFSYHFFGGRFVRPKWKIPGKIFAYLLISFILSISIGAYSLIFIIGHQLLGGIGHYTICKSNDIDFWTCQPEEKYLELTERWGQGNFQKKENNKNPKT